MHVMIDQFVQQIVASGLMTCEEIEAVTEQLPVDQRPRNSEELGRELVRQKKLTPYQAKEIYYGRGRLLVLGNYVTLDKLGQGGMGLVVKAEHRRMERLVALKVLSPKFVRNAESVRRFQREVKAAARLTHPNIVTAYDADEANGVHFLVMEYVEGSDLAALVRQQGPLPLDLALDCVLQAAAGLQYAHERGVVHRDIKPGNLLLDRQGSVRILDMGLARLDTAGPHQDELTGSGQIMGTVDYMAPEQAASTRDADGRADIYSLGATWWYLMTGRPMYTGETPVEKLIAHQRQEIPSFGSSCDAISAPLEAVFQRMVAKMPQERYQSMAQVIADLQPLRAGASATTGYPSGGDSKLDAFLRGIGTGAGSHRPGSSPRHRSAAETRDPKNGLAADQQAEAVSENAPTGQQVDTDETAGQPQSGSEEASPATATWRRHWKKLAACGMVAVVLPMIAALLLLRPPQPEPFAPAAIPQPEDPQVAEDLPEPSDQPVVVPSEPPPPVGARLVLHWPPSERADSRLEIDGRVYDPAEWADPNVPDGVSVPLGPGEHRVWIARRGFEPFEQTVRLDAGQQLALTPQWQTLPMPQPTQEPDDTETADVSPSGQEPEVATTPPGMQPPPEEPAAADRSGRSAESELPAAAGPTPEELAALEALEAAEALWREATAAAEDRARDWDFAGAAAALDDVQFDDPPLAAQLEGRKNELQRMADLKQRMIERINAADPPLKKRDLALRGAGGDVTGADPRGITATLPGGRTERLAWGDLGSQAPGQLLQLVVDQAEADDWVRAGVFALGIGDVELAERLLAKAGSMGVDIGHFYDPLARTAFDSARKLLDSGSFVQAVESLEVLESKYGGAPWLSARRPAVAAARAAAQRGVREALAEALYAKAVGYFKNKQLFNVRPLVARLRDECAGTTAVTDSARQPSFAELQSAVSELGTMLTVRQDGKGDYTKIQAAIDAALPNSLIEIQDHGIYREQILIKQDGLTLRGQKGRWPLITSAGFPAAIERLIHVSARDVQIEQLVVAHTHVGGGNPRGIELGGASECRIVRVIVFCESEAIPLSAERHVPHRVDTVFVTGFMPGRFHVSNSFCLHRTEAAFTENSVLGTWEPVGDKCEAHRCVILKRLVLPAGSVLIDSIVPSVQTSHADVKIEFCNVHGETPYIDRARPGEGCFSAPPMFAAPKNRDYRLLPNSPGLGKASDGGDVGVRFTPEMTEILKQALELRARGIIKF